MEKGKLKATVAKVKDKIGTNLAKIKKWQYAN